MNLGACSHVEIWFQVSCEYDLLNILSRPWKSWKSGDQQSCLSFQVHGYTWPVTTPYTSSSFSWTQRVSIWEGLDLSCARDALISPVSFAVLCFWALCYSMMHTFLPFYSMARGWALWVVPTVFLCTCIRVPENHSQLSAWKLGWADACLMVYGV